MQTIFALATARGKSGVAVIRISGPDAFPVAEKLVGSLPGSGRFVYRSIVDGTGQVIDRGLVLVFQGPRSFTGEDVVELQTHGSVAIIQAIEHAILNTGMARMAEAGEFTRRALLNDRMDLGQVEALGDLIEAETEQQRLAAQAMLDGRLGDLADVLRQDLLHALALIEVTIDFADEEVPVDVGPDVLVSLSRLISRLKQEIAGSFAAEQLRDGFEVAILGAPNVGKSTLLNRIAGRDVAITSTVAGTTRDVLEVRVDLGGIPVTFLDTAGLRDATDTVERIGIERAIQRANAADLRVFLHDRVDWESEIPAREADLTRWAKIDEQPGKVGVSGLTGQGVDELLLEVRSKLEDRLASAATANRARHRDALEVALRHTVWAYDEVSSGNYAEELVAAQLREAVVALDSLVGAIDVEAVLGAIFSRFCIGK